MCLVLFSSVHEEQGRITTHCYQSNLLICGSSAIKSPSTPCNVKVWLSPPLTTWSCIVYFQSLSKVCVSGSPFVQGPLKSSWFTISQLFLSYQVSLTYNCSITLIHNSQSVWQSLNGFFFLLVAFQSTHKTCCSVNSLFPWEKRYPSYLNSLFLHHDPDHNPKNQQITCGFPLVLPQSDFSSPIHPLSKATWEMVSIVCALTYTYLKTPAWIMTSFWGVNHITGAGNKT